MTAKWIGRERLRKRFQNLPRAVTVHVSDAMEVGANEIVAMQKRLAPRDDGDLAKSIKWVWRKTVVALMAIKISAGDNTGKPPTKKYAHLVEFGAAPHTAGGRFKGAKHPGAKAQPFFFPAYRALRRRVRNRIARGLRKAVAASRS